jgi:hypothetical protein
MTDGKMAQDRENYCWLIGLNPLKESTYKPDQITKAIDKKVARWKKEASDKQNDPQMRFASDANYKLEDDIRRVFADPVLRKKEFKEGTELLKSKATRLTKDALILHNGTKVLIPGTADKYIKTLKWDGISKDDMLFFAGLKEYKLPEIVSSKVIAAYKGVLSTQSQTVAEMLNSLIGNKDLDIKAKMLSETTSNTLIKEAFDICEKRVNNLRVGLLSTQDTYIQAMRAVKLVFTPDKEMNSFIKYCACQKALAPIYQRMDEDYHLPFTRKYIDGLLMDVRGQNVDSAMAIALLEEYCVRKKYIANFSTKESVIVQCPSCYAYLEDSKDLRKCTQCGCDLRTVCPNCRTEQTAGNNVCKKCGFDFAKSMNAAKDSERKFKLALRNGDMKNAKSSLDDIQRTYGTYMGLAAMNQAFREASGRMNQATSQIDQAYKQKRYFDVKNHCEAAELDFQGLFDSDYELKKKRDDSVARVKDAEELCAQGEAAADPEAKMQLYVSAAERCPDHPAAKAKLREHPPEGPADASAVAKDSVILVKWAIPVDYKGMMFSVYRGRGSMPQVDDSTVPIDIVSGSTFVDRSADPGVEYYYTVHSKRWGVLSREAASCGPVVMIADVTTVQIEAIDGGLRLSYEKPRGCTKVRIWRKEGAKASGVGEEVEVIHNGETVIDDIGLRGDVKYFYLFVAEYTVKKRTERSPGTVFSGTTVRIPDPVRNMDIRWNKKDGTYTARWENKDEVLLFSSPKRVKMYGKMVPLADVNSWMTQIHSLSSDDKSMTFSLPDGAVQYIYPMVPFGKMAVRGKEMMVANLKPFRDVEVAMSGDYCVLTMNWPTAAESAVIAVMDDGTPSGHDDPAAEKIRVAREAYNADKQVRIPMKNSKKRTVGIYAVYDVEGDKIPSRGLVIDVYSGRSSKVRYRISKERETKGETLISVDFITEAGITSIPPVMAVSVQEGIPLKRWDGECIWRSVEPVRMSNGMVTVSMTVKRHVDLERVRLFFEKDDDYNLFKFIHPLYGRDK